jgi:hypothetical protein
MALVKDCGEFIAKFEDVLICMVTTSAHYIRSIDPFL